ncbi:YtxH domain-containing protein [Geomicrobium sp. JCM 19055]|uniref:YtxH domain-containing protein n=1 Tax=Geomicrobium sp. JCM 19055 TaxID=1460649 RepID=UPI00045EDA09|nr:general stress protein [Geomicrobium sp. JCM 19055]
MSDMNTKDFLIGTLIGGIVGASAALLFAPKSGKELRGDISEGASTAKDKTYELLMQLTRRVASSQTLRLTKHKM